jgi:hypothetical protein
MQKSDALRVDTMKRLVKLNGFFDFFSLIIKMMKATKENMV